MAKNISDLDKSLLTTSDYTNNTDVSIDTDYSAKIGALDNLKTSNKGSLVAAINELFQSGTNAKQQLVDALVAKGVSCSTSDSWDTLMNHINEGAGGGLDIISATELPATGKENQICIVSEHTDSSILVTTNYNEPITEPTHLVYLGNSASSDLTLGTLVQIGNIMYYFNKVMFGDDRLASYMWSNNQWNELTKKYIPLFENQAFVNTEFSGTTGVTTTSSYATLVDDSGEKVIGITGAVNYYRYFTFSKKINFTNFTKLKVTAKASTTAHKNLGVFALNTKTLTTSPQYTAGINNPTYQAISSINTQNYTESTIDISSWVGELYLTFSTNHAVNGGVYIRHISLE